MPGSSYKTLGPRLGTIFSRVSAAQATATYDCLWDLCCDHGYLGINILQAGLPGQLFFVDQVPTITDKLQQRLGNRPSSQVQVLTTDAGGLRVDPHKRHLMIIAGVTGTNVIAILQKIIANNQPVRLDMMICATRGNADIRQYLQEIGAGLLHECLVTEKSRHYEVLHVSVHVSMHVSMHVATDNPVSAVGEMWDLQQPDHVAYLKARVSHYQRESQHSSKARSALLAYQSVLAGESPMGSQ